jgi:CBS domain-containing protein
VNLGHLLPDARLQLPPDGAELEPREALARLVDSLPGDGAAAQLALDDLLDESSAGRAGRFRRLSPSSAMLVLDGGSEDAVALGIRRTGWIDGDPELRGLLVFQRARHTTLTQEVVDAAARILAADGFVEGVIASDPAEGKRALHPLLEVPVAQLLRVRDAFEPSVFRIVPDATLEEIQDLMVRKSVWALPVVGSSMEIIGIVTAGDVLRASLQRGEGPPMDARQLMSRTVLCVTEDQLLRDAARTMVQRDLAQLPVVRNGELVGFLSRESVLRRWFPMGNLKDVPRDEPMGS